MYFRCTYRVVLTDAHTTSAIDPWAGGVECGHTQARRNNFALLLTLSASSSLSPSRFLSLSQQTLDLRNLLLNGVRVRCVGRQENQLAASGFDQLPDLLALVRREVVHDYHLTNAQAWSEYPLDIRLEEDLRDRSFHRQALLHASCAHARDESSVLAAVARHFQMHTLSARRVTTIEASQQGVGAHLVYENQLASIELSSYQNPPGSPQERVALAPFTPCLYVYASSAQARGTPSSRSPICR